ncbi:MAG TPA: formate dehydrogenase accessory sulfurtransferase FdhD [Bryobacteraceae bacterium]|nr:formate dehydrogenase accessory sulfurtransferase FdhD [Bryobacteraceae bacterium]
MTAREILAVPVRRFRGDNSLDEQDLLAVEEPLQIRAGERDLVITMRTPGNDAELAAGFLFTEGLVDDAHDILDVRCDGNTAEVTLAEDIDVDRDGARRNFYMTSSCGICGKASLQALEAAGCAILPPDSPRLDAATIRSLPAKLRDAQAVFNRTGGLHAAGLFSARGKPVLLREDVGRHNAVDKLVGRALLDGRLPLHDYVLMVSGRTSFELLQKAARAGIPVLAAVGAPSSLAVKAALRFGITLIGFLRDDRFNVYTSRGRIREAYSPSVPG